MTHFERTEGEKDNLGNVDSQYRNIEDFADENAKTVEELVDERAEARKLYLREGDKGVFNPDDFDFTPSV